MNLHDYKVAASEGGSQRNVLPCDWEGLAGFKGDSSSRSEQYVHCCCFRPAAPNSILGPARGLTRKAGDLSALLSDSARPPGKDFHSLWIVTLLFFFGWLWVSVIACKLSLVAACGPLAAVTSLVVERGLEGTWASVVVAHLLPCSMACGLFLDQGSNPRLLHWQAESQPLDHQGDPTHLCYRRVICLCISGFHFLSIVNLSSRSKR